MIIGWRKALSCLRMRMLEKAISWRQKVRWRVSLKITKAKTILFRQPRSVYRCLTISDRNFRDDDFSETTTIPINIHRRFMRRGDGWIRTGGGTAAGATTRNHRFH